MSQIGLNLKSNPMESANTTLRTFTATAGISLKPSLMSLPRNGAAVHFILNESDRNEPQEQPYGERQYNAQDFYGHRWDFTETITDVAPEEWSGGAFHLE